MAAQITVFNEQEVLSKKFRIYGTAKEPLFLAKDVAEWIEHNDVSTMLRKIDEDEKVKKICDTNNVCTTSKARKSQEMWFLTENGLYEVLMQSRKPIAKQFRKKVKEILKNMPEKKNMTKQSTQLQLFNNSEFGEIRTVTINEKPMFCLVDVCKALGITHITDVKKRLKEDGVVTTDVIDSLGRKQNAAFVNESNLYKVIFQSRKESAERFTDWVTSEVLPTIRKTGGYVNSEDTFVNTYLPFLDESQKELFRLTLHTINEQNQLIREQREKIEYQDNVIQGIVEDISLADKRQILNRVMRHNATDRYNRWVILYREFDAKYHMNTKLRMERYNTIAKKKMKSRLEYIDEQLNMLSELYEIATKLFHEDVEQLVEQMYYMRLH